MSPRLRQPRSPARAVQVPITLAALSNAAHLATGSALVGLGYGWMGGATGQAALTTANLLPLAALFVLLPLVVNGTFYLELAVGRTLAWVDARLTVRWEAIVYLTSATLALGWLALARGGLPSSPLAALSVALAAATVGTVYIIRMGVRADELQLIQRLSQAIAAEINLARSFQHIQDLTRRLVPWEHMGFARYDAKRREMELIADTATGAGGARGAGGHQPAVRVDADASLTGGTRRGRRPLVAPAPRRGGARAGLKRRPCSPRRRRKRTPCAGAGVPSRPGATRPGARERRWRRPPRKCARPRRGPCGGSQIWASPRRRASPK